MILPDPVIPGNITGDEMPSLLANWFLGSKAKRYLSRRRFMTVTGIAARSRRGGRALDAGCGWGYNLFLLERAGFRPFGIDIVQNDFTAASKVASANRVTINIAGADISALPFVDSAFSAVTAVETFEHIFEPDRVKAVREAARVLEPGGVFVLSTPNYRSLIESVKRLIVKLPILKKLFPVMCYPVGDIERGDYHPYSYHRPMKPAGIRKLLESEGFAVTGMKRVLFVFKNTPDLLFPLFRTVEYLLERIPLVRVLAGTLIVTARKDDGREGKRSGRGRTDSGGSRLTL